MWSSFIGSLGTRVWKARCDDDVRLTNPRSHCWKCCSTTPRGGSRMACQAPAWFCHRLLIAGQSILHTSISTPTTAAANPPAPVSRPFPTPISIRPRYRPSPAPAARSPKNRHRTFPFHPIPFPPFALPRGSTSTTPSSPASCAMSTSTSSLASNSCIFANVAAKASASLAVLGSRNGDVEAEGEGCRRWVWVGGKEGGAEGDGVVGAGRGRWREGRKMPAWCALSPPRKMKVGFWVEVDGGEVVRQRADRWPGAWPGVSRR